MRRPIRGKRSYCSLSHRWAQWVVWRSNCDWKTPAKTVITSWMQRLKKHLVRVSRGFIESATVFSFDGKLWIPDDLPHVAVGVLEIPRVTAPERRLRRLDHHRACSLRLLHHRIHLVP